MKLGGLRAFSDARQTLRGRPFRYRNGNAQRAENEQR
jgi:hypothetical protein